MSCNKKVEREKVQFPFWPLIHRDVTTATTIFVPVMVQTIFIHSMFKELGGDAVGKVIT